MTSAVRTLDAACVEQALLPASTATPDDTGGGPRRVRRRRRWVSHLAVLVVVGGVVYAAVVVLVRSDGGDPTTATAAATSTAEVVLTDLVLTDSYDATLDYATARAVVSRRAGTVTLTNTAGTTVAQGQSLYSVDGVPVVLFLGDVPAYRELSTESADGADIRQLEENLVAVGMPLRRAHDRRSVRRGHRASC